VDFVDTPEKLEAARLAVNTNRRLVSSLEIAMRVEFLAKAGLKVEQIMNMTGLSKATIYRHMPPELKDQDKSKAISQGKLEASEVGRQQVSPDTSSTKTSDMALEDASLHKVAPKAFDAAEVKECERCHVSTTVPKPWHGHTLCSKCFERAEFNPVAYDGYFKMLERGKATVTTQPKVTAPSIEAYKDREARMHPQKSKMEEELLLVLGNDEALRPVVTDRGYPIVTVTPDFVLTKHNLAIFIDGEQVHAHRQDRDDDLRKKLADRHGLKVLSITYSANTEAEKQRIIAEIKGAIQ
jgi:very-short-patch-repair endonuclease